MAGAVERGAIKINFAVNNAATIPAYRIVKNATTANVPGSVGLWDTSTARMVGISTENGTGLTGTAIQVCILGTTWANAGASITGSVLLTGLTGTGQVVEAAAATQDIVTAGSTISFIGQSLGTASTNSSVEIIVNPTVLQLSIV